MLKKYVMSVLSYPIDCISVCFVVVEGQEVDKDVIEDEDNSSEGEESIEGYSEEGKKDDDISRRVCHWRYLLRYQAMQSGRGGMVLVVPAHTHTHTHSHTE